MNLGRGAGAAIRVDSDRWRWVVLALAFGLALVALVPFVYVAPNTFDEGFVASGAMLIRRGALPIRDFFVIYGPGQYYLTAAVFSVFGEDLFFSRAAHLLQLALLCAAVAACTQVLAPRRWVVAAAAALGFVLVTSIVPPNSGYAAVPATLLLLVCALVFSRWAETGGRALLVMASVLVGVVGLLRWDFGVYGVLALGFSALLVSRRSLGGWGRQALVSAVVPALLVMVALFLPFIVLGDAARWFDEVPRFHLLEFKQWRNANFVGPTWQLAAQAWAQGDRFQLSQALSELAFAALPLLVGVPAVAIALTRLLRAQGPVCRADALALILGCITLLLYNQMRVRSGFPQGYPALVAVLPLVGYVVSAARAWMPRAMTAVILVLVAVMVLPAVLYAWQGDLRVALSRVDVGTEMPKAGHTRIGDRAANRQAWSNYVELIRYVRQTTEPGEAIFSGVQDTSRLYTNDAMLYFLVDRPSAVRFVEMEPGLSNTDRGQRELVDALEGKKVRWIILWRKMSNESNATARTNGILILDNYVQLRYSTERQFGEYVILKRRSGTAGAPPL